MKITSSNLLQVNATIIIRLLILLSFSSLSSPVFDEIVSNFVTDKIEIETNMEKTNNLFDESCATEKDIYEHLTQDDIIEKCKELELKKLEMEQKHFAHLNYGKTLGLVGEGESFTTNAVYLLSGPTVLNGTTALMIIPFVVSSIVEFIRSRNSSTDQASTLGKIILFVGFVGLIIGMITLSFVTVCSQPAMEGCPDFPF